APTEILGDPEPRGRDGAVGARQRDREYRIAGDREGDPRQPRGFDLGHQRLYMIGLVVFTGAALISALSHSLTMLALGRALQGLGAAGMMSVNTALVRFTYPRRQLGRGIAMVSVVVSVSSAAGPSVAAAILAVASWPWLFASSVPVGLAAILMSLRL